MSEFYCQCQLKRINGQVDMVWIPEDFAHKGKYIKIRRGKAWENGWKVIEVYDRASEEFVLKRERDYLVQRSASDI